MWRMSRGEDDNRLGICLLDNCGTMLMTNSFIIYNITF